MLRGMGTEEKPERVRSSWSQKIFLAQGSPEEEEDGGDRRFMGLLLAAEQGG